jgi:hypothetical protein
MMKTKNEIQYHLNNTAYNKVGAHKIVAFLLGKDIIKKGEKINFKAVNEGEKTRTFDHFYKWFMSVNSKDILNSIFEDLGDRLAWALENEKWEYADRIALQIDFLVDAFESGKNNKKRAAGKSE